MNVFSHEDTKIKEKVRYEEMRNLKNVKGATDKLITMQQNIPSRINSFKKRSPRLVSITRNPKQMTYYQIPQSTYEPFNFIN
jgi:hypothetical protein